MLMTHKATQILFIWSTKVCILCYLLLCMLCVMCMCSLNLNINLVLSTLELSTIRIHSCSNELVPLKFFYLTFFRIFKMEKESKKINFVQRNKMNLGKQMKVSSATNATTNATSSTTKPALNNRTASGTNKTAASSSSRVATSTSATTKATLSTTKSASSRAGSATTSSTRSTAASAALIRTASAKVARDAISANSSNGVPTTETFKTRPSVNMPSKSQFRRKVDQDESDVISSLVKRNIHEALLKIFLPLDSITLTACREVDKCICLCIPLLIWFIGLQNLAQIFQKHILERKQSQNWNEKETAW